MPQTDWTNATDEEILAADVMLELGLEGMDDAAQRSLLETMAVQVQEATFLKALTQIDSAKKPDLEALVQAGDAQGIQAFLDANVPNFGDLARDELIRFKRVMLTESPAEREALDAAQQLTTESPQPNEPTIDAAE